MHRDRPNAEDVAAARYFVANRAQLNLDPADALDLARTSWATLRLARPDAALPPGGARILTVPRPRPAPAPACPCLYLFAPRGPKGAA